MTLVTNSEIRSFSNKLKERISSLVAYFSKEELVTTMRLPSTPGPGPIQLMNGRSAYDCALAPKQTPSQMAINEDAAHLLTTVAQFVAAQEKSGSNLTEHKAALALTARCPESKALAEQLIATRYQNKLPIALTIGVK